MRVVVSSLLGFSLICSTAWAVESAPAPTPAVAPAALKQRLQHLHHKL